MSCATSELIFFCILRCSCEEEKKTLMEEKDSIRRKYNEKWEASGRCQADLAKHSHFLKQQEDHLSSGLPDCEEGIQVSELYYKSFPSPEPMLHDAT